MSATLDTLLTKLGSKFQLNFEPLIIDEHEFQVLNIANMPEHLDHLIQTRAIKNPLKDLPLWAKVWPASFVLGRLLRKYTSNYTTLLELGAGCGILSLTASCYGFSSILCTDIHPDALTMAQINVLKNNLEAKIKVQALDVGAPSPTHANLPHFDMIAAAELLYLEELHRPLVKFLQHHLNKDGLALFCTDHARHKPRFAKLASQYFTLQEGHIGVKTTADDGVTPERRLYDVLLVRHYQAS
ncbi:MAG: 50S ribosomal protein L11 methyltransferase [Desulfovibrionaceae bacterium]|nr:50S ribosomal protein L11 methyltransferase [Desulfovibrionaceae bacterium]